MKLKTKIMGEVKGEGVLVNFFKGNEFLPFGCARTVTLNLLTDIIGKSTVGSGKWKEKEAVALDWNFTMEGIIFIDKAGNFLASDIYRQWTTMQPISLQFTIQDDSGGLIEAMGYALITNVSTNGAINNTSSFNITGEGTGVLWTSASFQIINVQPGVPSGGKSTLTFSWDLVPGATAYTIRITDLTTNSVTDDTIGFPPRDEIVTNSHSYVFALKPEPSSIFGTEFGNEIYWP